MPAAILARILRRPSCKTIVIAIDRDPEAIAAGGAFAAAEKGRLALVTGRFGDLEEIVAAQGIAGADGVVLDIGVSSMQLDQAERGFSFRQDGPLDMRMEREGTSAADLVNEAPEAELADIFYHYGEERRARAVARAIIETRRHLRIASTRQLAELVAGLVRQEPGGAHPATRVFQALRIAVNDELGELVRALHAAERLLKPGGRLAVVTFHSLEDRIVKQFFAARTGRAAGGSRHMPSTAMPEPSFVAGRQGADRRERRGDRAQPARALGQASCRGAHRRAGAGAARTHSTMLADLPRTADKRGGRR